MRLAGGPANPSALAPLVAQLHHQGQVALRLQMICRARAGYPVEANADVVVCHPQTVPRWLTRYDTEGLRRIVQELNGRGVRIEFVKEQLTFSGEDSPMATLLLSVMGAFAEFERALIRERQREGVALAKERGAYKGRRPSLSDEQRADLRRRADSDESKLQLAHEFGISRETVYQYVRVEQDAAMSS